MNTTVTIFGTNTEVHDVHNVSRSRSGYVKNSLSVCTTCIYYAWKLAWYGSTTASSLHLDFGLHLTFVLTSNLAEYFAKHNLATVTH